jgi:hypothetical protein
VPNDYATLSGGLRCAATIGYFLAALRAASTDYAFDFYDFGGSSGVAFFRFGARSTCLAGYESQVRPATQLLGLA